MMDANDLVYLRARHYHPGLGVFTRLDPEEGGVQQTMSLNRYSYVAGNPTNFVDPSGMILEIPFQDRCYQEDTDIRSGCKICWMIWEDIYQNEPDFGLNWPYYLGRFEQCLEKYNCPSECYTYPYCRNPVSQGCGIVDTLANLVAVARELSFLPVTVPSSAASLILPFPGIDIRSGRVKTRGFMIGFEGGIPPVGGGLSGGASVMLMYEGDWLDIATAPCEVFGAVEVGVAGGADTWQFTQVTPTWSTASLEQIPGGAINFSGDIAGVGLGIPLIAEIGIGANLGLGFSASGCNVSAYANVVSGITASTFSVTRGDTLKKLMSCTDLARLFGLGDLLEFFQSLRDFAQSSQS